MRDWRATLPSSPSVVNGALMVRLLSTTYRLWSQELEYAGGSENFYYKQLRLFYVGKKLVERGHTELVCSHT